MMEKATGIKKIFKKLENSKISPLFQFIKFGLVGISNTIISYGIEMLCYYVFFTKVQWEQSTKIFITTAFAFFISVTNSYYWNNRYVFKTKKGRKLREHIYIYLKTIACYGLTGLLLAPMIKIWLGKMGMPFWLSSIATLIITVPLNFFLNKFWAYKDFKQEINDKWGNADEKS